MKDEIIEGLKKLKGEEWTNFDDARCEYTEYVTLYDELTETSIELIATCESVEIATIIAEMPRWLQWQNDRIEQLEKALEWSAMIIGSGLDSDAQLQYDPMKWIQTYHSEWKEETP